MITTASGLSAASAADETSVGIEPTGTINRSGEISWRVDVVCPEGASGYVSGFVSQRGLQGEDGEGEFSCTGEPMTLTLRSGVFFGDESGGRFHPGKARVSAELEVYQGDSAELVEAPTRTIRVKPVH